MSIPPAGGGIPPTTLPPAPGTGAVDVSQDDRTMAMLAYLLGIVTGFLGPLVIWLIKKDQSKFVAYHGLQALLLHAVVTVGYILSGFLTVFLVGLLGYPVFFLLGLVYALLAGLAANRGEWYEIPVIGPFARQSAGV